MLTGQSGNNIVSHLFVTLSQTTDPRHEPWDVRYEALREFVVRGAFGILLLFLLQCCIRVSIIADTITTSVLFINDHNVNQGQVWSCRNSNAVGSKFNGSSYSNDTANESACLTHMRQSTDKYFSLLDRKMSNYQTG